MSTQTMLFDNAFWKKNKSTKVTYNYMGKKNTDHYKKFKDICRMTQKELKEHLADVLCNYYDEVYMDDGFLYVKGTNSKVLLTAHMDTVHEPQGRICTDIYEYYDKKNKKHILSSPQGIGGDDRCGIYAIIKVLELTEFRPYIVFCEDEECGGIGSNKFCKTTLINEVADNVNFMVEIDRANANDAVFYEETNPKFQEYILSTTGNKDAYGSFSDICHLSPESLVSSFNISCGYYNAHTTDEYVVFEELDECINKVVKLLETNKKDDLSFAYEEYEYKSSYLYDYDYGYNYGYGYGYSNNKKNKSYKYSNDKDDYMTAQFLYHDEKGKEDIATVEGISLEECIGVFMMRNPELKWSDVYDYYVYGE